MNRGVHRDNLAASTVAWTCMVLTGCLPPKPAPPEPLMPPLVVAAHCTVFYGFESPELPMDDGLVLPNTACVDHSSDDEAHPGGPLPNPYSIVLSVHNPGATNVTLATITLETDPAQPKDLRELLVFRARTDDCLEWLSSHPSGLVQGSASFVPKVLHPGETCYVELELEKSQAIPTSKTTGSIVFRNPNSLELASLPISVSY